MEHFLTLEAATLHDLGGEQVSGQVTLVSSWWIFVATTTACYFSCVVFRLTMPASSETFAANNLYSYPQRKHVFSSCSLVWGK